MVESEIIPGLFVGGRADAAGFQGIRICVLDNAGDESPAEARIPILTAKDRGADRAALDKVAARIQEALRHRDRILVYCGYGVRRSPLAVAWFLHRTRGHSLDDAYQIVQKGRAETEPAYRWLSNWASLSKANRSKRR
jgi:atypical dual specificity phosphatase